MARRHRYILTYATTLVSIAEAITLISSRLTLWTAIIELLTGSFTNGILFIVSMGGYSIPTIFYILYLTAAHTTMETQSVTKDRRGAGFIAHIVANQPHIGTVSIRR